MQDSNFSRSRWECLSPSTQERVTSSKTHDSSIAGEARAERNTKQHCDFHTLRPEPSKRGTDRPHKKQRHSRPFPWPSAHSHEKSKALCTYGPNDLVRVGKVEQSPAGHLWARIGVKLCLELGLPQELEHSTKGRGQGQ